MRSTMQDDYPLTIAAIFRHGRAVYASSEVATFDGTGCRRATFAEVAERADRLAAGLAGIGVVPGDRVGTFSWNNQEHLEAYLAVPSMGAVLHTLNLRLFPEQLAYVINHAEDKVVIVEASIIPLLARVAGELKTVERYVVFGEGDTSALPGEVISYEELLAAGGPGFSWPELDERSAAAMCYTSGTTGNPKGVVYSHRSTFLHSLSALSASLMGLTEHDKVLPIVPMFHANAWGMAYAGWLAGSDFLMPGRFLQAEPLCRLMTTERPTFAAAVPTIWNEVLRYAAENPCDLSSLRLVPCGGSAVPLSLMQEFEERHGVRIVQAWGMTETSPLAALAHPPKGTPAEEAWSWRERTGRVVAGVEARIVDDDGNVLACDGEGVGEIQVRGPWVTGSYYLDEDPARFQGGWLCTGDVGTLDRYGFLQITDRAKDVIKSGGEWISSVELETKLMAHPDVIEAAVIGIPDERWDERPLACVVLRPGAAFEPADLQGFLAERVAKWWLPESWSSIAEVPKTSVGKFDKKVLRQQVRDTA